MAFLVLFDSVCRSIRDAFAFLRYALTRPFHFLFFYKNLVFRPSRGKEVHFFFYKNHIFRAQVERS